MCVCVCGGGGGGGQCSQNKKMLSLPSQCKYLPPNQHTSSEVLPQATFANTQCKVPVAKGRQSRLVTSEGGGGGGGGVTG